MHDQSPPRIAVIIPCYNEGVTIAKTVADMQAALPDGRVYVYDNNSRDNTIAEAMRAGAIVRVEKNQGKGSVVRRMFADIDADVYLMVDGDATYDAAHAPEFVKAILEDGYDFVNGARRSTLAKAYRPGHKFGNRLLTGLVRVIFGEVFTDMLSGYKCFSRRYVKSFPALSKGFEIETELTIHALELRMPCAEITTPYGERPEGSTSKLSTYRDGWKILITITNLVRAERPLQLFGGLGVALAAFGVLLALPVLHTYLETGQVPRIPTTILCTGMVLLGGISITLALILDNLLMARRETKRIAYAATPMYRSGKS